MSALKITAASTALSGVQDTTFRLFSAGYVAMNIAGMMAKDWKRRS